MPCTRAAGRPLDEQLEDRPFGMRDVASSDVDPVLDLVPREVGGAVSLAGGCLAAA